MNAWESIKRLVSDKRFAALVLMLLCGAVFIALSYRLNAQPKLLSQDLTYTESSMEQRLANVLSMIDGAGQVDVLVTQGEEGVLGVLVVADGAEKLTVRTDLMRAAMTALDVPADSVEVFARIKEVTK